MSVVLALLALPGVAHAVENGTTDPVSSFAVAIATGGPASPSVRCSGTLVSPNVVLTVRHCIAGSSPDAAQCKASFPDPAAAPGDFWVTADFMAGPSLAWKNVSSWVFPAPNQPCGADLALLVLDSPMTTDEASFATIALTSDDFRAAALARVTGIAGYGSSSAAGTDSGVRRSRFDVPVQCVPGDSSFACGGELAVIDASEFTTGDGPCTGDSGAGAIANGTKSTIFGVLSRGTSATGACGAGIFERTDVWRWLIAKTVLESTPSGQIAPSWASASFPEAPHVGELCRGDVCGAAASCVSFDADRSYVCAARCESGCADGTHCTNDVCAPGAPAAASGGCAVGHAPTDAAFFGAFFALLLARRQRGSSRSSSRRFRVSGGVLATGRADAVSLAGGATTARVPGGRADGGGGATSTECVAAGTREGSGTGTLATECSSGGATAASTPPALRENRIP